MFAVSRSFSSVTIRYCHVRGVGSGRAVGPADGYPGCAVPKLFAVPPGIPRSLGSWPGRAAGDRRLPGRPFRRRRGMVIDPWPPELAVHQRRAAGICGAGASDDVPGCVAPGRCLAVRRLSGPGPGGPPGPGLWSMAGRAGTARHRLGPPAGTTSYSRPARYMSVHTGIQAAHRTDSHGHCPQNHLTCANQHAEPCAPKADPARANVRRGKADEPLTGGGYHPIPRIPGLKNVISAQVTTMIAATGRRGAAASCRGQSRLILTRLRPALVRLQTAPPGRRPMAPPQRTAPRRSRGPANPARPGRR